MPRALALAGIGQFASLVRQLRQAPYPNDGLRAELDRLAGRMPAQAKAQARAALDHLHGRLAGLPFLYRLELRRTIQRVELLRQALQPEQPPMLDRPSPEMALPQGQGQTALLQLWGLPSRPRHVHLAGRLEKAWQLGIEQSLQAECVPPPDLVRAQLPPQARKDWGRSINVDFVLPDGTRAAVTADKATICVPGCPAREVALRTAVEPGPVAILASELGMDAVRLYRIAALATQTQLAAWSLTNGSDPQRLAAIGPGTSRVLVQPRHIAITVEPGDTADIMRFALSSPQVAGASVEYTDGLRDVVELDPARSFEFFAIAVEVSHAGRARVVPGSAAVDYSLVKEAARPSSAAS